MTGLFKLAVRIVIIVACCAVSILWIPNDLHLSGAWQALLAGFIGFLAGDAFRELIGE